MLLIAGQFKANTPFVGVGNADDVLVAVVEVDVALVDVAAGLLLFLPLLLLDLSPPTTPPTIAPIRMMAIAIASSNAVLARRPQYRRGEVEACSQYGSALFGSTLVSLTHPSRRQLPHYATKMFSGVANTWRCQLRCCIVSGIHFGSLVIVDDLGRVRRAVWRDHLKPFMSRVTRHGICLEQGVRSYFNVLRRFHSWAKASKGLFQNSC